MFNKPLDVTVLRTMSPSQSISKVFFLLLSLAVLSACTPPKEVPPPEPPPVVAKVKVIEYNSDPIVNAEDIDVRFAQTALKRLGYRIGFIDGLWGPRSATAIRAFEVQQQITSANGHLSELNLHHLEKISGVSKEQASQIKIVKPTGISIKLHKTTPLSAGPQLIIVDHAYKVLSKPNPYSSQLLTLAAGTGIYIISKQDGWFEIESINRKRGYVRVD